MSSVNHNSTVGEATGLIFFFLLFNIALAQEMPFGILQYVPFMNLPASPIVSHSTVKWWWHVMAYFLNGNRP